MSRRKPTLRRGPAAGYEGDVEIIREFSDGKSGGLLSIRRNVVDDVLDVLVYNQDQDVTVSAGTQHNGAGDDRLRKVMTFLQNTIAGSPDFGEEWTVVAIEKRGDANLQLTLDDATVVQLAVSHRHLGGRS